MNHVLIIDACESDYKVMAGLLTKFGYNPAKANSIEIGKVEAAKLPPGAVIVSAMRLLDGTARELIDWLNAEDYKFPVSSHDSLHGRQIPYYIMHYPSELLYRRLAQQEFSGHSDCLIMYRDWFLNGNVLTFTYSEVASWQRIFPLIYLPMAMWPGEQHHYLSTIKPDYEMTDKIFI